MNRILLAAAVWGLMAVGCQKYGGGGPVPKTTSDIVYLETNDYHPGQNAILAYKKNSDGTLSPVPGSPFKTEGDGIANPKQALGPDDSDDQLKITADGKFLLAVNAGSNTVAVFQILENGGLVPVNGSPFSSEGLNPVSIALRGNQVFVANQANATDSAHLPTSLPNYVTFNMDGSGKLSYVAGSKVETSAGSSPSQVVVSADNQFVFATDFLGFMQKPPVGTLRSFKIAGSGKLAPVPGTPYPLPAGLGGALGLAKSPKANILYVGFPVAAKVGVYMIGADGSLSYNGALAAGPAACWLRTTKSGNNLYALNSAANTIAVYNSYAAQSPTLIETFALKNSGPLYGMPGMLATTSQDFGLAFSQDEKTLYVISQYTNPDFTLGQFNLLHVLNISSLGQLSEPGEPLTIPVDASVRPQGIATVAKTFVDLSYGQH